MIWSSKDNREHYPRKCFRTPEKETRVKFNPGLSANRPSNNWAQVLSRGVLLYVKHSCDVFYSYTDFTQPEPRSHLQRPWGRGWHKQAKNLLMVLKTYSCKDLQAFLKNFKVNFVVVVVVVTQSARRTEE